MKKRHRDKNVQFLSKNKSFIRTMKFATVALLLNNLNVFAIGEYPESSNLTLKFKNAEIKEVINQIESQTDYLFVYNNKIINLDQIVTVDLNNKSIYDVLNNISRQTGLSYVIQGNNILLTVSEKKEKEKQQQEKRNIKGVVSDAVGPIIGANVSIKGTAQGTITDADGNFELEVPEEATLLISYIGFQNAEMKVGNSNFYNILLKEDSQALDEVVVIGYGTTKRKDFTGSVSSVRLEDSPVSLSSNLNALEAIKGNVAGLDIGATNSAGGQPSRQMRGQKSISGSNDPLAVVDGVRHLEQLWSAIAMRSPR